MAYNLIIFEVAGKGILSPFYWHTPVIEICSKCKFQNGSVQSFLLNCTPYNGVCVLGALTSVGALFLCKGIVI